jgi:hypothetical protein
MPEDLTDSEVELLDQTFAELPEFAEEIQNRKTDAAWFANLLVCILHATLGEYQNLKLAIRTSTALLSWSCRNLLELNIYVQHALMSEANAKRFVADRLIDGVDILSGFKTWLARNDPALALQALDDALGRMTELRAQQDGGASKALALRGLAAEVGLADEYANMNALCAKLSRPTAYSVLAMSGENELLLLRPTLFRAGAGHGLEIYQTVKGHVDVFGVEPRP